MNEVEGGRLNVHVIKRKYSMVNNFSRNHAVRAFARNMQKTMVQHDWFVGSMG